MKETRLISIAKCDMCNREIKNVLHHYIAQKNKKQWDLCIYCYDKMSASLNFLKIIGIHEDALPKLIDK
jgi:hypothetical protein